MCVCVCGCGEGGGGGGEGGELAKGRQMNPACLME